MHCSDSLLKRRVAVTSTLRLLALTAVLALSACRVGGGDDTITTGSSSGSSGTGTTSSSGTSGGGTAAYYMVGGTINGLAGSGLVLQNNGGNNLTVAGNGSFLFTISIASGRPYAVMVLTQPTNPSQTCTVANGTGTVGSANVTNVVVTCTTNTYTVGGSVTGLNGTGLVLADNGGNALPISGNGTFTFTPAVASGTTYAVTVGTQPATPAQYCTVANGTGTVTTASVTTVAITCRNTGKLLFTANTYDGANGSLSAFTIDPASGALTPAAGSPFASTGINPQSISIDPTGSPIYVADSGSGDVATYSNTNGVLGFLVAYPVGANLVPDSTAIAGSGPYLYVGDNNTAANGNLSSFLLAGGIPTQTAGSPVAADNTPYSLAIDSQNRFVFTALPYNGELTTYAIGAAGDLTAVAGAPFVFQGGNTTTNQPYGVAAAPAGNFLYVTDAVAGSVTAYSYDATGTLSEIGAPLTSGDAPATSAVPRSVAIDPVGSYLYVANSGDGTVSAYGIAPGTGALTAIATYLTGGGPSGATTAVQVDPSGQFLYVTNGDAATVTAYAMSRSTGTLGLIGSYATGGGSQALAIE